MTKERLIPENASIVVFAHIPGVRVYLYESNNRPAFMGYHSDKALKPKVNARFVNEDIRDTEVKKFFEHWENVISTRNDIKDLSKTSTHDFQEGSILVYSWGYDQTNQEFYQVISLTSKTVTIRQLVVSKVSTEKEPFDLSEYVVPVKDSFQSESVMRKKVSYDSSSNPYIKMDYGRCILWNGVKKLQTHTH